MSGKFMKKAESDRENHFIPAFSREPALKLGQKSIDPPLTLTFISVIVNNRTKREDERPETCLFTPSFFCSRGGLRFTKKLINCGAWYDVCVAAESGDMHKAACRRLFYMGRQRKKGY